MGILVPSRPYTLYAQITNPGAVTNFGVQAAASRALVLIRAQIEVAQAAIPTAAGARVQLVRKTAAPTWGTAVAASTFLNRDPSDADASFTAGHTASANGTDGDFIERGWRTDVGFDWDPTPEEYILIPAGTANGIALKHTVAPPAGVYDFIFTVHEIG